MKEGLKKKKLRAGNEKRTVERKRGRERVPHRERAMGYRKGLRGKEKEGDRRCVGKAEGKGLGKS